MEYTRADVERFTTATESQMTHWSKIGLFRAGVRETQGRGHHRRYSFENLVEARIAVCLNAVGVPTATIEVMLERLRSIARGGAPQSTEARRAVRTIERAKAQVGRMPADDPIRLQAEKHSQEVDAARRKELEDWRAYLDPATRDQFSFVGFVYDPFRVSEFLRVLRDQFRVRLPLGQSWFIATRHGEPIIQPGSVFVLINVKTIIEELERATGDAWPKPAEPPQS